MESLAICDFEVAAIQIMKLWKFFHVSIEVNTREDSTQHTSLHAISNSMVLLAHFWAQSLSISLSLSLSTLPLPLSLSLSLSLRSPSLSLSLSLCNLSLPCTWGTEPQNRSVVYPLSCVYNIVGPESILFFGSGAAPSFTMR